MVLGATPFAVTESVCPFELNPGSESLNFSRHQSVLRIHGTGPGEKKDSDLEGDPSLVLLPDERIAAERFVLSRIPVEMVPVERVLVERIDFEQVPSCHSVQVEHWKDKVCNL